MEKKNQLFIVPVFDTEGPSFGRDDLYGEWQPLLQAMKDMTQTVRHECPDKTGMPMIFSWFMLDWVGYSDSAPLFKARKQATGYHGVFDMYRKELLSDTALSENRDGLYWHYHHPPKSGEWGWNRDWSDAQWYEKILNKKILERNFFPSVFRAGGYVENNETSAWLERWIPFDYSNNAPAYKENAYDWSRAPIDWLPYHPGKDDYQQKGDMNRSIVRCLPVLAKGGSNTLTEKDVEHAFELAAEGKNPILSFSTHDYYKSAAEELRTAYVFIKKVAQKYPNVVWRYENARDAIRKSCRLDELPKLELSLAKSSSHEITINANHALFGDAPYCVMKRVDGIEERVEAERTGERAWRLKTGSGDIQKCGVAANDPYGNTAIEVVTL